MYREYWDHVVSVNDCLEAANELFAEAKKVATEDMYRAFWDRKAELLKIINGALETGFWTGKMYDTLWEAKNLIYTAENRAVDNIRA